MIKLYKKTVMVTGATGGIGEKICERIVMNGYKLIIIGRNQKKLEALIKNLKLINFNSIIYSYLVDLSDVDTIEKKIERIYLEHDNIDILINNAGIGYFSSIQTTKLKQIKEVMNINFISYYLITKIVLMHMINVNKKHNYQIINISSIAGQKGFELGSIYNSSKFAVEGFTQALWHEAKKYEIKVCIIRPGLVNTCFFEDRNLFNDIRYALQPDDVAKCVEFVIQQSEFSNISEIVLRPIKNNAQTLFTEIIKRSDDYD